MVVGIADGTPFERGAEGSRFFATEINELYHKKQYLALAERLETDPKNLPYLFKMSLEEINKRLYHKRMSMSPPQEMCSAFSGILSYEMDLHFAHAGHARAYRVRGGKVSILTQEHVIGEKVSRVPPPDHYNNLYRAFGLRPWIKTDFQSIKVEPNDIYIFATRGFYQHVDERKMVLTMMNLKYNPQKSCEALVEQAQKAGCREEISVACIFYLNYMGLEMNTHEPTKLKY
jgi:serine/threonine protein phosphatase PrpC